METNWQYLLPMTKSESSDEKHKIENLSPPPWGCHYMSYSHNSIVCIQQTEWVFCSAFIPNLKNIYTNTSTKHRGFPTMVHGDSKSLEMRCTPPATALKLLKTQQMRKWDKSSSSYSSSDLLWNHAPTILSFWTVALIPTKEMIH